MRTKEEVIDWMSTYKLDFTHGQARSWLNSQYGSIDSWDYNEKKKSFQDFMDFVRENPTKEKDELKRLLQDIRNLINQYENARISNT
jgi:hypothetical protein